MARLSNLEGTNQDIFSLPSDWEKNIGTGLDYTSIGSAIADLDRKTVSYPKLTLDAGTYTEKILDGTEKLLCSTLELIGDTRTIVGSTYVDNFAIQTSAVDGGGEGTCQISNSGNDVTVTGTTTNPNFETAGLVAGDKIITLDNANAVAEYEIASVSSNVLTLTSTAPTIGNEGTTLTIVPNRTIDPASEAIKWENNGDLKPMNIYLKGFRIKNTDSINGIYIAYNAGHLLLENCIFDGCRKVLCNTNCIGPRSNSISVINLNGYGLIVARQSYVQLRGLNIIKTTGLNIVEESVARIDYNRWIAGGATTPVAYVQSHSSFRCDYSVILGYYRGVYCMENSYVYCGYSIIKNANIGVYALNQSHVQATSMTMSGNTTNYSPATSGTAGNVNSTIVYS